MTIGILLRDVTEDNLSIFFEHQLDPAATEMAAFPARDKESFMADDAVILKTILFDGQVAGNIVSFEQSGEREVGYWIGKEYWGKGIATKALAVFLSHVRTRRCMPMSPNTISALDGSWKNAGSRLWERTKGLSTHTVRSSRNLFLN